VTETTASPVILTTGLDLGDRTTHLCTLDSDRRVVERKKFATTRDALIREFGGKARQRVVIEAGSQSLWVGQLLADLGHEVMVVDPRRVKLIAESDRKTDRRDAETLARLALGVPELLGRAHHRTLATQADLSLLRSRDVLVGTRTKLVTHVRGILKAFGIKVPTCSASCFHRRAEEYVPLALRPALLPILATLEDLERRIRGFDDAALRLAEERYPDAKVLRQVGGVGPLVSIAYVLTVGDPHRFRRSRDVGPWVGLCPKTRRTGDDGPELPINKRGDAFLRRLLVIAAHYILGPFGNDSDLRRYGLRLCERGGANAKKRAVVAVARKLAVLLHRLWISGAAYEPLRNSERKDPASAPSASGSRAVGDSPATPPLPSAPVPLAALAADATDADGDGAAGEKTPTDAGSGADPAYRSPLRGRSPRSARSLSLHGRSDAAAPPQK